MFCSLLRALIVPVTKTLEDVTASTRLTTSLFRKYKCNQLKSDIILSAI